MGIRFWIIFVILAISSYTFADVPLIVNYQGKLTDDFGVPLEDPVNLTFNIWDSQIGGTKFWEQILLSVNPEHGLFSVELDFSTGWESGFGIDQFNEVNTYLQITVNGEVLSPRERITASFHALNVADTSITNSKIRWAEGGAVPAPGQISAINIPIEDEEGLFTIKNVEGALQQLGSGSSGSDNDWQVVDSDMFAIPSGNVGIGSVSPSAKLEVRQKNENTRIRITTDDGTGAGGTADVYVQYDLAGGGMAPGGYIWTTGIDNSDGQKFKISGSPVNAYPGNNDLLTIQGNGNVGIGTTTPGAKLELNGQIKITGGAPGDGKVLTSDAIGLASWSTPDAGGANELADLTDVSSADAMAGNILIANGTDWYSVALHGDATIDASGLLTVSENAIGGSKIAIGGDARGDILFFDGTDWARLPAGGVGEVLTTFGPGADPSWITSGATSEYTQQWENISTPISGSWQDVSLGIFAVPGNTLCEINILASTSGSFGVREKGSYDERRVTTSGSITMNVKTDAASTIQYYRGSTADFYLAGYWGVPSCYNPTAEAGPDGLTCGSSPYALNGIVTNEESILWTTSGTGNFNNSSIANPTYTPSAGDVSTGSVILTIKAFALPPCIDASDDMSLSIISDLSNVAIAPSGAQNFCSDGIGDEILCTPTDGGTPSYQWGKRSTSGGAITNISGQTSSTFTPDGSVLGTGTWFIVCTVTPECGSSMTSNEVTVTVISDLSNVAIAPTAAQEITDTETGTMLACTPVGGGAPSYQWGKRSTSGGAITNLAGQTSSTYTPDGSALGVGTWFIVCTVIPECGSSMTSNEVSVVVTPPKRRIFVTSTTYTGNLGSYAGACDKCASHAASAGLSGIFKAILSDPSGDAVDRLSLYDEAYYNMKGDLISPNPVGFWDGSINNPVLYDQNGNQPSVVLVWTGSGTDGRYSASYGLHCNDWTSASSGANGGHGQRNQADYNWLQRQYSRTCNNSYLLYCIETCTSPSANAGPDDATCGISPYSLSGSVTDEESILWTTSGSGSFDDATIEDPTYTPSAGDITAGSVTLTITAYSGSSCPDGTDNMLLTIVPELSGVAIAPTTEQNISDTETGTMLTCNPTGGGTPSYQWGKRSTSGGAITNLAGQTSSTYTPDGSALGVGTWFIVCNVTPECGSPITSNEIEVNVTAGATGKIIFVTSTTYNGNLGGYSGACSKCATRASAAGLTGTFKAILSDQGINAKDRITLYDEPYYNTNGDKVANNGAAIWSGSLLSAVTYNESGASVGSARVWTGSSQYGISLYGGSVCTNCMSVSYQAYCSCNSWTAAGSGAPFYSNMGGYGMANSSSSTWLYNGCPGADCANSYRIYCIEVNE